MLLTTGEGLRTTLGALATIPSVQMVQILARAGLDWILIDLEHGAITAEMARAMIAERMPNRNAADAGTTEDACIDQA